MRRLIASSLAALMMMLGVPLLGAANGTAAGVFGQVVDASGRGSAGKTVELLRNGAVIGSTVTSWDGRFTINGIAPGTYIVRTTVNGQPSGIQVALKAGETAPVIVVLPSMVTAQAQAQFASLLANLATTVAGTTMATVVTTVAADAQADADVEKVEDAVETQAALQTLVNALQAAVSNPDSGLSSTQISAIVGTIATIAVSLPPETPVNVQDAVTQLIQQTPVISVPQPGGLPPVVIAVPPPVFTGSGAQ